ncbi:ABC transporter substrate-binding protein [Neptuniibacter sp.]|uniref:ABC transporter substrate-binding protein n=1 Tax=Neptuniibacter sp. TaxID=1962643 RepID=UPI00262C4718|nr:ABC transporter substrate-binding protein [Neptuniibacter sp.]MCP4596618.1 ABC transporter substrate-binding protein [Neptuniibacter sp.]
MLAVSISWILDIRPGLLSPGALQATQVEGTEFPLKLTDAVGETIFLQEPPQRIVSVTLTTDEILAALVHHSRIAAVTSLADNPAISNVANYYPDSVSRIRGEVEEIIALQPDLVFISPYTRAETVRLLLNTDIPVVRLTEFNTLADIKQNLHTVAAVTNTTTAASKLLQQIDQKLQSVEAKLKNVTYPRVLFYNLNGSSVGPNTTIDEIIHLAGGYNVLRDTGINGSQKINEELVIGLQPDIVLTSGWADADQLSPAEQLMKRTAWQNVPAVKNNRVYDLKGNWLFAVSQFSWNGVEQVASIIHPELFSNQGTTE